MTHLVFTLPNRCFNLVSSQHEVDTSGSEKLRKSREKIYDMRNKIRLLFFLFTAYALFASAQSNNGTLTLTPGSQSNLSHFNSFTTPTFYCGGVPNQSTFDIDLSYEIQGLAGAGYLYCGGPCSDFKWIFELIDISGNIYASFEEEAAYNASTYTLNFSATLPNEPKAYLIRVHHEQEGKFYNQNQIPACSGSCSQVSGAIDISNTISVQYPSVGTTNFPITSNEVNGVHEVCSYNSLTANVGTCVTSLEGKIELLDGNGNSYSPKNYVANFPASYTSNFINFKNLGYTFVNGNYYNLIVTKSAPVSTDVFKIKYLESFNTIQATDAVTCEGQNVSLTASGPGNLIWSPNTYLNSSNGTTVTAIAPNSSITYTVTSNDPGCNIPKDINLTVHPNPDINFSANPPEICTDDVPFQVQHTITPSGGTYNWSAPFGTSPMNGANPTWDPISNPSADYQGDKTFGLTYVSTEGCSSYESFSVFYNKLDVSLSSPTLSCSGGNTPTVLVTATVTGGVPPYKYEWPGDDFTTTSTSHIITLTSSNPNFGVTVTDVNGNGICPATYTMPISIPSPLTLDPIIPTSPICEANSTFNQFGNATVNVNQIPNTSISDYSMTVSSTNTAYTGFTSTLTSFSTYLGGLKGQVGATDNYTVSVTHTPSGCVVSKDFMVSADYSIDASISTIESTCSGKDNGEIVLNTTSSIGSGTQSYHIQNLGSGTLSANTSITGVAAGTYPSVALRVYDSGVLQCNVEKGPIMIDNQYTPSDLYDVNIVSSGASCLGVANGQLVATAWNAPTSPNSPTGGVFTYDWSNGVLGNQVNSNLLANNYAVTVTDGQSYSGLPNLTGCIISQSASVANNGTNGWQIHTDPTDPTSQTNITSMAVDAQDNVYMAGTFTGDITVGGQTFSQSGGSLNEFFVASYNSCGGLNWLTYSQSSSVNFDDLQITESNGRVYVANLPSSVSNGTFNLHGYVSPPPGTAFFNSPTLQSQVLILLELNGTNGTVNQDAYHYNSTVIEENDILKDIEKYDDNLYITGHFVKATSSASSLDGKAKVLETNFSTPPIAIWEDQNMGNIFYDLEFNASGELFVSGKATNDVQIGTVVGGISVTSDAFVVKGDINGASSIKFLKASLEGEALGLALLSGGRMAVVGNYNGTILGFGGGTISSYSQNNMGFIANMAQSNLDFGWVKSLEGPATTPISHNNINYAQCTDVSVNSNGEVFVYGKLDGSGMELMGATGQANTNGSNSLQNIWNGKVGGFGSPGAFSVDWLTSMESPSLEPVAMVSGSSNNYISGNFMDYVNVNPQSSLNAQTATVTSGYLVRFGDALDPNQGGYYKKDESEIDELSSSLTLYPNPANSMINLEWESMDDEVEVTILDVTGRMVMQTQKINGELGTASVDIKTFDAGTYFVTFRSASINMTKPFVKQ